MRPEITLAVETLTPSTIPAWMLADHYAENAMFKDALKLAPDWDTYIKAQSKGEFIFVSAREVDGPKEIVGYVALFLRPHPHYRQTIVAVDDVHYLMPAYRGAGLGKIMLAFAEGAAKERGATIFSMRTKAGQDHGYIFTDMGYVLTDLVYVKDLRNV
jgi:GNAT superfamily N-acetyltransferase